MNQSHQSDWTCPRCGSHVDRGFDTCWNCGSDRAGVLSDDFEPAVASPIDNCRVCGYSLREIDSPSCPECGEAIDRERLDTPRDAPTLIRRDSARTMPGCLLVMGCSLWLTASTLLWVIVTVGSRQAPFILLLVLTAVWLLVAIIPIAVASHRLKRWADRDLERRQRERANTE